MEVVLIDKFIVSEESKVEFWKRREAARHFLGRCLDSLRALSTKKQTARALTTL
jgi:hypothetical protein